MGLSRLRLWLFRLCQIRAGQCLHPAPADRPARPDA